MMFMKYQITCAFVMLSLTSWCGCIANDAQSDGKQLISDSQTAAATTNSNVDGSGKQQPDKRDAGEPGKPSPGGQRSDPSGLNSQQQQQQQHQQHQQQPVPVQYRAIYASYPYTKLYTSAAAAPQIYYVKSPSNQQLHTSVEGPIKLAYSGPEPPQYTNQLDAAPQPRYQLVYSSSPPQQSPFQPSQHQLQYSTPHQPPQPVVPLQTQQSQQYPSFIYAQQPQPQHLHQSAAGHPQHTFTVPAGVNQHQLAYSPYPVSAVVAPNQHAPPNTQQHTSSPTEPHPSAPSPTIIRYLQQPQQLNQYETQEKQTSTTTNNNNYQPTYYQTQPQYVSAPSQHQLYQQQQQQQQQQQHQQQHVQLQQQQQQIQIQLQPQTLGPVQGHQPAPQHGRTIQVQSIASRPPVAYYTGQTQPAAQNHPYFAISPYPNQQSVQLQPAGQTLVGIPSSSPTLSKQFRTFGAPVASPASPASVPPGGQDGSSASTSHQGATSFATFTQQLSQQITPTAIALVKQHHQQQHHHQHQQPTASLVQPQHQSQPYAVAVSGLPPPHQLHSEKSPIPPASYGGSQTVLAAAGSSPQLYATSVLDAGPDGAGAIHYGTRLFHPSIGRYSYGPVNPSNQRLVFA